MIALLQRVSSASVAVAGERVAGIDRGLLVFVGIQKGDDEPKADRLLQRVLGYRMFNDGQGRMNRSVVEVEGEVLLVSQFTLAADTKKGTRASFSLAADPARSEALFDYLVEQARANYPRVETGQFGAYMKVSLVNDGPVTFWLEV